MENKYLKRLDKIVKIKVSGRNVYRFIDRLIKDKVYIYDLKIINIKNVRGKFIATLLGSIYNINPTLNKKNPPITLFRSDNVSKNYEDLDFGGFTCIESDYLYRHYTGQLAIGDFIVFSNVGSYSIVLKPPFILPNFPVLDICNKKVEVIKQKECFDDLFHTFSF